MHAEEERTFLKGSSHLPVQWLLLLQGVPDSSEHHEDDDDPKEHHLRGIVLRCEA